MVFFPAVLFPLLTFGALYAWPWLEGWFMRDQVNHHLVVSPRYRPVHTAIRVSFFSFYFMLFMASGDDVIAKFFTLSLNQLVWAFRISIFAVPCIVFLLVDDVCKDLQKVPGRKELLHPVRVDLTESGAFVPALDGPSSGAMKEELEPIEVPDAIVDPAKVGAASGGRSLSRRALSPSAAPPGRDDGQQGGAPEATWPCLRHDHGPPPAYGTAVAHPTAVARARIPLALPSTLLLTVASARARPWSTRRLPPGGAGSPACRWEPARSTGRAGPAAAP